MRRIHIAALLVAGAALAACSASSAVENTSEEQPSTTIVTAAVPTTAAVVATTTVAPVTTTELEVDYSTARATLEAWAKAIGDSDVDAALATHRFDPDNLMSEREAMGYLTESISYAGFNDCEFSTLSTSRRVTAQCDLTLVDPILVATGLEPVRVSWQLSADGKQILRSEPGYRMSGTSVFVPYAEEHYGEEFADVCGPGTVNYNALVGWGFNRACGEFTAEIADEVAAVIYETG